MTKKQAQNMHDKNKAMFTWPSKITGYNFCTEYCLRLLEY